MGVLTIRALLFGVYIGARDVLETSMLGLIEQQSILWIPGPDVGWT